MKLEVAIEQLAASLSRLDALLNLAEPGADEEAQQAEHEARLIVAPASLPEKEQDAIRRRYFEQEECQAIAAGYGVAPSSVSRWCDRGIRTMCELFFEDQ